MPANPFDSGDRALLDVATRVPGPAGTLPFTAEMLRERPSGDLFGWTQNAGMGWEPSAMTGREFLILSTHGGIRAPDGTPDRPRLSHRPLGSRTADGSGGTRVQGGGRHPVRRRLHRSVRRPLAGHAGDVRQPGLSQRRGDGVPPADSIAADAQRRARRGHLRQGPAGDDDGAGRHARPAVRARARRRHAAAGARERTPRASRRLACATCTTRSRCRTPPISAAVPVRPRAAAASSSAPPRPPRSSPKRWA